MSVRVQVNHITRYKYSKPVFLAAQWVRLRPAPHCQTEIQHYALAVEPSQHFIHWQQDPLNNYVARLDFSEKIDKLTLSVEIIANIAAINPYNFFIDNDASHWPFRYEQETLRDLSPYLETDRIDALVQAFLADFENKKLGTVDFLIMLNQAIYNKVDYIERFEPGIQSCFTTLEKGSGSCRDSAWLLVQALRHFNLAARFVSGYSIQLIGSDTRTNSSDTAQDSTDLHAWAEVFIPGAGWIGLDPSSGLLTGQGYIPLCCARNPLSAAPITGLTDSCETEFSFENTVTRLAD